MIAMKSWVVLCLLMVPLLASADSFWEGNAALQRGDAAFENGLYAASNSFAPDTQLMVRNLENGKSAIVTVSQRTDGQSDILILLSPKAADALGIQPGSIVRVRITEEQKAASAGAASSQEGTYNPDSDVNPGAAYAGTSGDAGTAAQQQPPAAGQESTPQGQQPTAADQSTPSAEDAQILAEAAARNPQKQLFLPPREDQKFAYKPASPEQTAQAQEPAAAPGETPTVTGETAAPSQKPSEVPLPEAQPEPQATPQEAGPSAPQPGQPEASAQLALPETGPQEAKPAETSGTPPAQASGGEELALQPPETPPEQATAGTPPVTSTPEQPASTPVVKAPPETQPGQVQVVASLPKLSGKKKTATFYVQLGAYSTQEVAQGLAVRLMQTYPVVVLAPSSGDKQMYKVLVGPLNKAESGTLLPLFKFRGFRDAFVRRE
jgi:rare lipoprotein A (peptidoglycan hydrolase)